jgi:hypothetical protein
MKYIIFLIYVFLSTISFSQGLIPRHAQAQAVTSDCQTFLHFKLKGTVQIGDDGAGRVRFPMSCNKTSLICKPLPISAYDSLGNLWVFTPNHKGYGKDYAEFDMNTVKPSIASGPVEVVIPWSCGDGVPNYGIEFEFDAPWIPE